MAVIRVGGATEVEVRERKDRVDDAMHATRATVEEGIVPGGGVALLRAIKALDRVKPDNDDQRVGVDIVRRALAWPAKQVAQNAGADGSVVVGKILETNGYNYDFDAQENTCKDFLKALSVSDTDFLASRRDRRPLIMFLFCARQWPRLRLGPARARARLFEM